jgi:hypothetical protein
MAEVTTYKCDECGKLKQEGNHWFKAISGRGKWFFVINWGNDFPDLRGPRLDLCGLECAHKAMEKALSA